MKQYTEADYTDWFPGDVKPVRNGVYERKYGFPEAPIVLECLFAFGQWSISMREFMYVDETTRLPPSGSQNLPWRGLKREPK